MQRKLKVSIIIVHYKAQKELFDCLHSIEVSRVKAPYEVIVVDNDERKTIEKELKKRFPWVRYIKAPGNIGFGAGNNLGVEVSRGEYLFFLNPDTEIKPGSIDSLFQFIEKNKKVGVAAPLLLDVHNNLYPLQGTGPLTPISGIIALSFINKLFPNNPISKNYWKVPQEGKPYELSVVPGTAFMMPRELFYRISKFDERFFLYFEESDLCKRVREAGLKVFMLPQTRVMHLWGASTKQIPTSLNKNFFAQSRFYYFKKHYGIMWAWIVHLVASFGREQTLLLLIFLLAAFLRVFRIEENFRFDGEIGDNLLDIKNAFEKREIPLVGPPTSHPWLSFGPLFYWLYGPVLRVSNFSPVSHAYFGAFVSLLIVLTNFWVVKKLFDSQVAFLSSLLISISPLYLDFARTARFFSLVPLLIYPFIFFLYKLVQKEKRYFLWLGLMLGVMLNFHYSPLLLVPFTGIVLFLKKIPITKKDIASFSLGILLPVLPILVHGLLYDPEMIPRFIAWIPYRIAGFFGLFPKNNVSSQLVSDNFNALIQFFHLSFVPLSEVVIGSVITGIVGIYLVWKAKIFFTKQNNAILILLLWFLVGFVVLFIHGFPPIHYFVPLFPLPILFFSLMLSDFSRTKYGKMIIGGLLLLLVVVNLRFFFVVEQEPSYMQYRLQLEAVSLIVKDAAGQKFSLLRVGPNDQFEENYAQNYRYLLWWLGNEPKDSEILTYTIYEDSARLNSNVEGKVFWISNIAIVKKNMQ